MPSPAFECRGEVAQKSDLAHGGSRANAARDARTGNTCASAPTAVFCDGRSAGTNWRYHYVHGGVSLQELCVPVVHFKNYRAGSKGYRECSYATLSLVSPLPMITNLTFEIEVLQNEPVGGKTLPALYELQVVGQHDEPITDASRLAADRREPEATRRTSRTTLHVREQFASTGELRCRLIARVVDDNTTESLNGKDLGNSNARVDHAGESVLAEPVLLIATAPPRSSDW